MFNLFKWLWLLLKAMTLRKSSLTVSFTKEANHRWYVDFPGWPLSHDNLEMVAGADDLLDLLNDGSNHVTLQVSTNEGEHDLKLEKVHSALVRGAFYTLATPLEGWGTPNALRKKQLWLCPVTLCVLGQYPKRLYVRRLKPLSDNSL